MTGALTIAAVEPDEDYLGIEIHAFNGRFAGSTHIYAGLDELSEFVDRIAGFPTNDQDRRSHEFGSRDPGIAGGYCSLNFGCIDRACHIRLEVILQDDALRYTPALAEFSLKTEPAALIIFWRDRNGTATLVCEPTTEP